jgi:adenylylsulfate kinase
MTTDHPKRTLVKTVTWRLIAFATTVIVVYIYSRDVKECLTVGVAANLLKMGFYYFHERAWNRSHYGRVKAPEYNI